MNGLLRKSSESNDAWIDTGRKRRESPFYESFAIFASFALPSSLILCLSFLWCSHPSPLQAMPVVAVGPKKPCVSIHPGGPQFNQNAARIMHCFVLIHFSSIRSFPRLRRTSPSTFRPDPQSATQEIFCRPAPMLPSS